MHAVARWALLLPAAVLLHTATARPVEGQVKAPVTGATPVAFDSSRAYEHVRQLVAIGPRPSGSAGAAQARKYITAQLTAAGVTPTEQAFTADTPLGAVRMVNLIAVIPGDRPERLAFAGHYDTKLYRQFTFVGANDGGSSAAFLLELARVLKARRNAYTTELLFFDGEEAVRPDWNDPDNTYGSRHYVSAAKVARTLGRLKALILVDMIGDRDLKIRRETNSTPWLTDIIWASAARLKLGQTFINEPLQVEDDHMPFLEAGVPAVDIIDLEYPAWHTAADTLDKVSARSLQSVGDVLLDALPAIEKRLAAAAPGRKP